jgi:hypothetical protein
MLREATLHQTQYWRDSRYEKGTRQDPSLCSKVTTINVMLSEAKHLALKFYSQYMFFRLFLLIKVLGSFALVDAISF